MAGYNNVFDSKEEFDKLKGNILEGIENFSRYRNNNLTYGEIMYVMECILDNLRDASEKDAGKMQLSEKLEETLSFSSLASIVGRFVEVSVKKGIFDSAEEAYILHGEK